MHNLGRKEKREIYTEGGGKEGKDMDEREAETLLFFVRLYVVIFPMMWDVYKLLIL